MKYLITGASGQLGKAFSRELINREKPFLAFDHNTLDISNTKALETYFQSENIETLINCAAYNHVDLAELNSQDAYLINAHSVSKMAFLCEKYGVKFLHFSTDYIFDGLKGSPYCEEDKACPVNVYGRSKYLGEVLLKKNSSNYLLFRTSWVYGEGRQNFVHKLTEWAKQNTSLSIAEDEISVPTSTQLIARISIEALEKKMQGTYHLVPSGSCSRFDFALEVQKHLNFKNPIFPTSIKQFSLKAKRGAFLALDNRKLQKKFSLPSWKEDLAFFFQ